jgi:hypothetical protein
MGRYWTLSIHPNGTAFYLNSVFASLERGVNNYREAIEDDSTLPSIYSGKDTEITRLMSSFDQPVNTMRAS